MDAAGAGSMQSSSASSSEQPPSSSTLTTTYIPILGPEAGAENGGSAADDDVIPSWAMIEINGELLPPKEDVERSAGHDNSENDDKPLIQPGSVELGSVRFVNEKVRSSVTS